MTHDRLHRHASELHGPDGPASSAPSPGKVSLTQRMVRPIVLRVTDGGGDVMAGAETAIDRAAGSSGHGLPDALRARFESSLAADLSTVRLHTGGDSAAAAHAVGARAYTVGQDIHFAAGAYDPGSTAGLQLIAHEVAHTVQQAGSAPTRQHKLEVSTPGDGAEVEADRAAEAMVAGTRFAVSSAPASVQRQPDNSYSNRGPDDPEARDKAKQVAAQFEAEVIQKQAGAISKLITAGVKIQVGVFQLLTRSKEEDRPATEKKRCAALAAELVQAKGELSGLAAALGTISGSAWAAPFEKIEEGAGYAAGAIQALDMIAQIADTAAVNALVADPSLENAEAWANQIGSIFESASAAAGALPSEFGFITEYFAGCLRAPKTYITAFIGIMKGRYAAIDRETKGPGNGRILDFQESG